MQINKNILQLFLYLVVGGLATIVEWITFYVFSSRLYLHYALATSLAFIFSTFANWSLGRIILFHPSESGILKEVIKIYITSIIGLLLNILIMFIAIEKFGLNKMFSKIIATMLVFSWNFLIRKLVIYK